MAFNIQKFLIENKLTGQSQMREEDNTDLTMMPGEEEAFEDQDEIEDDWTTPEEYGSDEEDEAEPTTKDVKQGETSLTGIHKKQAQLQDLELQKDRLLMQLKSNIITLDQYKQEIGNIPAQIKKLRADLEQAMNISVDDEGEFAN